MPGPANPSLAEMLDTPAQMRRRGEAMARLEHQQDMADSAKLQRALSQQLPTQAANIIGPQPGALDQLLAFLMNPGKNLAPSRQMLRNTDPTRRSNQSIPNVYRGALQPENALPQMSPTAYPDWQRDT